MVHIDNSMRLSVPVTRRSRRLQGVNVEEAIEDNVEDPAEDPMPRTVLSKKKGKKEKSGVETKEKRRRRRCDFPVLQSDANHMLVSSTFFLFPGYYAYVCGLWFYALVTVITTVMSLNYWRYPIDGLARKLDIFTAHLSFAIYFVTGCLFVQDTTLLAIGIPGCALILISYRLEHVFWERDSYYWVVFHMLFHLFVALEQGLVLYAANKGNARHFFM